MYYLLENNMIIDENNMFLKKFRQLKDSGDPDFINADEKETLENFFGKIKLQGENVFDLIEIGDLIKIFWKNHNYIYIRQVTSTTFQEKYGQIDVEGSLGIADDEILEIYKPNTKGNYIKVWERGNDNDR